MKIQLNSNTIINKGNYGTAYDVGSDTVIEARIKSGKRGRPSKSSMPVMSYSNLNDLFGRVPSKAPKGTTGRVIIGKASE